MPDQPEKPDQFPVTIFNYETEVFSGEVKAVSSRNEAGPFDILGLHSNFITIISEEIVLHEPVGGKPEERYVIESGVLRCLETAVHVYIVPEGMSAEDLLVQ